MMTCNSPKVLSRILLYMMALDFLCTILCVIAWCRRRNSRSLCVDSMEADLRSGNVRGPPSAEWGYYTIQCVVDLDLGNRMLPAAQTETTEHQNQSQQYVASYQTVTL